MTDIHTHKTTTVTLAAHARRGLNIQRNKIGVYNIIIIQLIIVNCSYKNVHMFNRSIYIIESVDSISKDERGFPLTQYITNGRISGDGYTFTHFKHHHRVLRLISYRMGV